MLIIRSTQNILNHPWKSNFVDCTTTITKIPPAWSQDREMLLTDVVFWEQLYFKPGNIGIYVSWSPYAEFYMIVHNLYSHLDNSIETFYGPTAYEQVVYQAATLGVILQPKNVWVESTPLY